MAHCGFGYLEIGFLFGGGGDKNDLVGVIERTDEINEAIVNAALNPSEFDRIVWPIGASNYASGRFIVPGHFLDLAFAGEPWKPFVFQYGNLTFDQMYVRNPIPIIVASCLPLFAVEIVDERFLWHDAGGLDVFNDLVEDGTMVDIGDGDLVPGKRLLHPGVVNQQMRLKHKVFDRTRLTGTYPDPEEVEGQSIIEYELARLGIGEHFDLVGLNTDEEPFDVRNWLHAGYSAAKNIDDWLMLHGRVFVANPSSGWAGTLNLARRYSSINVGDGAQTMIDQMEIFNSNMIGGGVYAIPDSIDIPDVIPLSIAGANPEMMAVELPESVLTAFPVAELHGFYTTQDQKGTKGGIPWETFRHWYLSSTSGRPDIEASLAGASAQVFGDRYAEFHFEDFSGPLLPDPLPDPSALSLLEAEADDNAEKFYARFSSGACNILYAGLLEFVQWSGAQEMHFYLTADGPVTRMVGEINSSLFGYRTQHDRSLQARDVTSTGNVKALPTKRGGILLDALPSEGLRLHVGHVTKVYSNGNYDVVSDTDPELEILNQAPRNRIITWAFAGYNQLEVCSMVIIVVSQFDNCGDPPFNVDLKAFLAFELIDTTACIDPLPVSDDDAAALLGILA